MSGLDVIKTMKKINGSKILILSNLIKSFYSAASTLFKSILLRTVQTTKFQGLYEMKVEK